MKKAEIFFATIIIIGFVFRLNHWPYSSEIMSIAEIFLSIIYFCFGFAIFNNLEFRSVFKSEAYKHISKLSIFGAIGTGFTLSMLIIFMLFKLQLWPSAQIGLKQSIILYVIILAIVFVFYFIIKRKQFLKQNYIRFGIIGILSLLIYFISYAQLVDLYYGNDPIYAKEYKAYLKADNPDAKIPTKEYNSKVKD